MTGALVKSPVFLLQVTELFCEVEASPFLSLVVSNFPKLLYILGNLKLYCPEASPGALHTAQDRASLSWEGGNPHSLTAHGWRVGWGDVPRNSG